MGSLRQFSNRRVVGLAAIDWLGTLALLQLVWRLDQVAASGPNAGGSWLPVRLASALAGSTAPPLFVSLMVALLWPLSLLAFSVYDGRHNTTLCGELRRVLQAIGVASIALAGTLYLARLELPRGVLLGFFLLDAMVLAGARASLWLYRRTTVGRRQARRRNVLVIGAGPVGQEVVRQLGRYGRGDLDIVGFADDDAAKQGQALAGRTVLGTLDQVTTLVDAHRIHDAVVALPLRAHERLVSVCQTLQQHHVRAHVVPDLFSLSFPNAALDGFGGIPVITLGHPGITGWQRVKKRAFDSIVATTLLVITSPLALLIAVLIKLDSPGPVVFRQERIGENGRPFTMLKFRSMRAGADTGVHKAYVTELIRRNVGPEEVGEDGRRSLKEAQDSRVTRVGKVIRKASLDELPQLVNVLRGDMSLVGPRPPLAYEVAVYKDWHKRRLEALPGITGLWQVEGRNQVSFDEMVRLDLKYIENQSLLYDLKILVQTPWAMLTGRGAG